MGNKQKYRTYLLDLGGKLMKIMLPDKDTTKKEYDIGQYQSIVIIGANGSGKIGRAHV